MQRRALRVLLIATILAAGCSATSPPRTTPGGEHPARLVPELTRHHRQVTTSSPLAQQWFDQGLTLLYGFNHDEARLAFEQAAKLDPGCAMAYWGIAYSLGPNYNLPGEPERDRQAYAAVEKARAAAPSASEIDRAYVEAIGARYSADAPSNRRALDEAYAAAMEKLHQRYPDDLDAATLYAEALMDLQPWDLWTHEGEPKGRALEIVALLEGILKRAPDHPGATHYYIHAVEASRHPERATAAADKLRELALPTGHLVHMPSHIYVRTGRYRDATEANVRAVAVDEQYIQKWNIGGVYPMMYYPHNIDFEGFAAAMEGRSEQAIRAARAAASKVSPEMVHAMPVMEFIVPRAVFALVRFGRWTEILSEPAPDPSLAYASGVWHWARGFALAAKGDLRAAERELQALRTLARAAKPGVLVTQVNTGKALLGVARHMLAGEIAERRGRRATAVDEFRAAVRLEDELRYMEPPDWWVPARPYLGAALLSAGRNAEAEATYREDLHRNPGNGWSLFGLAESLRRSGRGSDAAEQDFRRAWERADVTLAASRFY